MTRYKLLIGTAAVAFALSVLPAAAQRPGGGGEGGGGGGGGERGGGPAGGGGASNGGHVGGGGGGGFGGSSSGGGGSSESPSSGGGGSYSAPSRSHDAPSRSPRAGGAGPERRSGERAVPRGSSAGRDESRATARIANGGASTAGGNADRVSPADRAVPQYSRPREGRPATGTAVERTTPRNGDRDYYYPYYPGSYRYYWPGYGFGLGYYMYDPFWFDPYYDPSYYGYGGGGGYYGGGGSYGYSRTSRDTGSLRLKIKPREAKVYIDGYFVGTVDSFDGLFQKLDIDAGTHQVEVKADGYEPLTFEVLLTPGETATYKGELKRIQ